jgi:hypothetical protein
VISCCHFPRYNFVQFCPILLNAVHSCVQSCTIPSKPVRSGLILPIRSLPIPSDPPNPSQSQSVHTPILSDPVQFPYNPFKLIIIPSNPAYSVQSPNLPRQSLSNPVPTSHTGCPNSQHIWYPGPRCLYNKVGFQ